VWTKSVDGDTKTFAVIPGMCCLFVYVVCLFVLFVCSCVCFCSCTLFVCFVSLMCCVFVCLFVCVFVCCLVAVCCLGLFAVCVVCLFVRVLCVQPHAGATGNTYTATEDVYGCHLRVIVTPVRDGARVCFCVLCLLLCSLFAHTHTSTQSTHTHITSKHINTNNACTQNTHSNSQTNNRWRGRHTTCTRCRSSFGC